MADTSGWQHWVDSAQRLGFDEVTIIARNSFQCLACSTQTEYFNFKPCGKTYHLPKAYNIADEERRKAKKVMAYMTRKYLRGITDLLCMIREKYVKLYCFVNENQELLDDWMDTQRREFWFYRRRFRLVKRCYMNNDRSRQYIVCQTDRKDNNLIAAQFRSIWFVVSFHSQKFMGGIWKDSDDAVREINNELWKDLQSYDV